MSTSNFRIIEYEKKHIVDVNYNVGIWNIWDFEHDQYIHGYSDTQILYENTNSAILYQRAKVPFLPFISYRILVNMQRINKYTSQSISYSPFSKLAVATMTVKPITESKTEFIMNYKVILHSYFKFLAPLYRLMIQKWTDQTWAEDLPLKLRRQDIIQKGFKDFYGIESSNQKKIEISIPLPKLKSNNLFLLRKKITPFFKEDEKNQ